MKLSIGKWTFNTVTKILSTTLDGPYPNGEDNIYYVVDDNTTLQFFNDDTTNGTIVTLDGGEEKNIFSHSLNLIPIGKIDIPLNSLLNGGRRKTFRNKTIRMKKSDYLREHHHLFKVLSRPTRRVLARELKIQKKELKERGLKG